MNGKLILASTALLVLGAMVLLPNASAGPVSGPGICVYELYGHTGYSECFGVVSHCGGGYGVGVGHWYWDQSGNTYTWCYVHT